MIDLDGVPVDLSGPWLDLALIEREMGNRNILTLRLDRLSFPGTPGGSTRWACPAGWRRLTMGTRVEIDMGRMLARFLLPVAAVLAWLPNWGLVWRLVRGAGLPPLEGRRLRASSPRSCFLGACRSAPARSSTGGWRTIAAAGAGWCSSFPWRPPWSWARWGWRTLGTRSGIWTGPGGDLILKLMARWRS